MSASDSGGIMVIFMVCITAGAFVGGKLIGRTGHYRRFVVTGFALAALALWQITSISLPIWGWGLPDWGWVWCCRPSRWWCKMPCREDRGIGMSLFNFGRELGGRSVSPSALCCSMPPCQQAAAPIWPAWSPAELAPGFSATYIGMALIATAALLVTLLALKAPRAGQQTRLMVAIGYKEGSRGSPLHGSGWCLSFRVVALCHSALIGRRGGKVT